jgi:MSHA biogenesis protein MshK
MTAIHRPPKTLTPYALLWFALSAGVAHADLFQGNLTDPTRPAGLDGQAGPAANNAVTEIRISARERSAVINGRSLKIGDRYGDGVVADIRTHEVILESAGRRTSLRLVPKLEKESQP